MDAPAYTTPLNDDYRVAVYYDDTPESPRAWGTATSVLTVKDLRNVIDVGHDEFPGDLKRADDELWHFGRDMHVASYNPGGDQVKRWARIFYGITIETDYNGTAERGTWWWVTPEWMTENYPTLTQGSAEYVAMEKAVIESEQQTYQAWAAGEVYGIVVERRVGVVSPDETLDVEVEIVGDEWEPIENRDGFDNPYWGVYLLGDYTEIAAARENFDLASFGIDLTTIPEK